MPLLKFNSLIGEITVFITEFKNVSELSLRISLDNGDYAKHCPDGGMYLFINLTDF